MFLKSKLRTRAYIYALWTLKVRNKCAHICAISLSDQMQLEAKSIFQVLGRWSRRPDFSRLRQLRHADTTPDSLRILDLQIYSLNWLSYGPRAWPLFNQMPPPPPNKSQTPVRTHSYHLITLILHRSLLFFFFSFFF